MTHLWEADHPYYCARGCYFERGCHQEHSSWKAFVSSGWNSNDEDLNLLFRWDWAEGEDEGVPEGVAILRLFFFLQRKGYPISHEVKVTRADEPAIRSWLEGRWRYIQKLWAPFSEVR